MAPPPVASSAPLLEVPLDAVEKAGSVKHLAGDLEILIVATAQGIRVYNGICPHLGGPLLEGRVDGSRIRCPWHDYSFDAATGACLTPPGRLRRPFGAAGPPPEEPFRLKLSPLRWEVAEGKVRVFRS